MRLLFVHDHRFYRDESGAILTSGSLPAAVWDRYLDQFETVHVVGRDGGLAPAGSNYTRSSHAGVTFDLIPGATYGQLILGSGGVRGRISDAVAQCDAAVVRLPSELGFLAAAECRRSGKPYAVEMVGCAWDAMRNHGSRLARLYAPLFFSRTRRALRRAPLTLYVTTRWLQQRYPTDGKAYAASDVEIAPMDAEAQHAREARLAHIAAGEPPVLGTVASLRIRSKGVQTALAALGELRRDGLELRYRVLGGGDAAPWAALAKRHGVADLVSFDGVRPAGHGVAGWLDSIDIHLQPSFQEGLPRATVEAMSRGCACIGSTCGGIPELIPPDRLHRPGDVAGLAERIRSLATDAAALAAASRRDGELSREFRPEPLAAIRSRFLSDLRDAAERAR
ncbi:MAG TPA: glycosyltransferase family 4 protein [Sphingomicrobium sp.]